MIEPMEEGEESPAETDPQMLLEKGRQLCTIGEDLIAVAKSMGAEDTSSEEEYSEEEDSTEDSSEESSGESLSSSPMKSSSGLGPSKMAIVLALKKKLGRK